MSNLKIPSGAVGATSGGIPPHQHSIDDVITLPGELGGKAAKNHTHIVGDVAGLGSSLSGAVATATNALELASQAIEMVNSGINPVFPDIMSISGAASAFGGKANTVHTHSMSDVTGLGGVISGFSAGITSQGQLIISAGELASSAKNAAENAHNLASGVDSKANNASRLAVSALALASAGGAAGTTYIAGANVYFEDLGDNVMMINAYASEGASRGAHMLMPNELTVAVPKPQHGGRVHIFELGIGGRAVGCDAVELIPEGFRLGDELYIRCGQGTVMNHRLTVNIAGESFIAEVLADGYYDGSNNQHELYIRVDFAENGRPVLGRAWYADGTILYPIAGSGGSAGSAFMTWAGGQKLTMASLGDAAWSGMQKDSNTVYFVEGAEGNAIYKGGTLFTGGTTSSGGGSTPSAAGLVVSGVEGEEYAMMTRDPSVVYFVKNQGKIYLNNESFGGTTGRDDASTADFLPVAYHDTFLTCYKLDATIPRIATVSRIFKVAKIALRLVSADGVTGNVVLKVNSGAALVRPVTATEALLEVTLANFTGQIVIERDKSDGRDNLAGALLITSINIF